MIGTYFWKCRQQSFCEVEIQIEKNTIGNLTEFLEKCFFFSSYSSIVFPIFQYICADWVQSVHRRRYSSFHQMPSTSTVRPSVRPFRAQRPAACPALGSSRDRRSCAGDTVTEVNIWSVNSIVPRGRENGERSRWESASVVTDAWTPTHTAAEGNNYSGEREGGAEIVGFGKYSQRKAHLSCLWWSSAIAQRA